MTPSHLRLSENGYYPCSLGLSYITEPIAPLFLFMPPRALTSCTARLELHLGHHYLGSCPIARPSTLKKVMK